MHVKQEMANEVLKLIIISESILMVYQCGLCGTVHLYAVNSVIRINVFLISYMIDWYGLTRMMCTTN